jgi:protein-S-isoprenylcysteine O-methyltransferase Ste14
MQKSVPAWAALLAKLQRVMIWDFPGRKAISVAWAINIHKIITLFIILAMMFHLQNFSKEAFVYLALQGVYGYCWLIKDFGFRDHRFQARVSALGAINLYWILIGWYWVTPWLFLTRAVAPTGPELFVGIALCMLGITLMTASDCQRHFTLKYKKGLMTGGLFKYTRNPNYLGEILIYASFAFLAGHYLAWAILGFAIVGTFLPNMLVKDASISRHEGWEAYEKQSSLLIPWALLNGRAWSDIWKSAGQDQ